MRVRSTCLSRSFCLVLLSLVAASPTTLATEKLPPELAYGLARYALDTGQPQAGLGTLKDLEGSQADLLRARRLLATGQKRKARVLLQSVTRGESRRADAALELALLASSEADQKEAQYWYQFAVRTGFGEVKQQALLGLADLARSRGSNDAAGKLLATMEDGYWAAVGYMNLAADFSRHDLDSSRALVALRVAMAMASKDKDAARSQDLLQRLYLRAGYLSLNAGEPDKAIDFFENIGLDSYYTPQALYLHGLALSEKGNYRAAMQSWHRAKKYPLAFPGVEEAWIGTGHGYDMAGYTGQAGESWLAANAAYRGERVTLGKLAGQIREQGAYKTLLKDARGTDVQWFLADSRTLTQPRMAYLLRFLEQPAAQEAVRRVAQLDQFISTLAGSSHDLQVFIDALEGHSARSAQPQGEQRISALVAEQKQLVRKLRRLRAEAVQVQVSRLDRLTALLSGAQQRLALLQARADDQPTPLDQRLVQARQLRDQAETLSHNAMKLRDEALARVDDLALAFVASEDQRMAVAVDKTEQQIAHLYEYLALQNLGERGE